MAAKPSIDRMIDNCAFCGGMPARAEQLVSTLTKLTNRQRRKARAHMRLVELKARMAGRATQVAGFNPHGAIRIANAMTILFRRESAIVSLRAAGYLNVQMERATRHQRGGNHELAEIIYAHLRDEMFIDEDELSGLRWAYDFILSEEVATEPPNRQHAYAPSGWSSGKFALQQAS